MTPHQLERWTGDCDRERVALGKLAAEQAARASGSARAAVAWLIAAAVAEAGGAVLLGLGSPQWCTVVLLASALFWWTFRRYDREWGERMAGAERHRGRSEGVRIAIQAFWRSGT